jgi:hypothetical protein
MPIGMTETSHDVLFIVPSCPIYPSSKIRDRPIEKLEGRSTTNDQWINPDGNDDAANPRTPARKKFDALTPLGRQRYHDPRRVTSHGVPLSARTIGKGITVDRDETEWTR